MLLQIITVLIAYYFLMKLSELITVYVRCHIHLLSYPYRPFHFIHFIAWWCL